MKFYCANRLLDTIEDQNYELLCGVRMHCHQKRGYMEWDNWGGGWIYEADESFRCWCIIAYGYYPAKITDQEFYLLNIDGKAYFSRERTHEISSAINTQYIAIEEMKMR